ncbi:MAG TPA: SAF domain-containing protein [Mycobacterium sp.]|nr:SAF domain-containing protein [Mycobacterium sp.]
MGDSLNPSALSRLTEALRPDWSRTVAARRVAAGALVILAAVAALRPDPAHEHTDIVVAARDLAPGIELTAADVRLESRTAATVPDGSQSDLAAVVGATLAGPTRRGEALTDVRLLGPRLAESAAGPNARIVPLHLNDTALLDLIRPGDVVDVLAAATSDTGVDALPHVVATDAVVVLVSEKPTGAGNGTQRVVLVALPAHAANEVAGAALVQTVTLTFH